MRMSCAAGTLVLPAPKAMLRTQAAHIAAHSLRATRVIVNGRRPQALLAAI